MSLVACHKEEQAVVGVAQNAVNAEHKAQTAAQVAAQKRDSQRAQLAQIPLPTKSLYVDVHEPGSWANPFISVDSDWINLRITMVDALIALPAGAWRYGRVVAVAESPLANKKEQPKVRRNVEAAIQQLNDLGIVVEEWPAR